METLKIEIPKGFEVESFDQDNGEIKFREKPKSVIERIKTIDDILEDIGLSRAAFDKSCEGLSKDERAYRILKMLCVSLNQGWAPNWNDSSEYKYFPWFEMEGSSGFRFDDDVDWCTGSDVGSRLCFKSRELARHAGEQFTDVYKQFMVIN